MEHEHFWINRTFCECLEEIRACAKTLNFGAVMGILEELQSLGNRMEAGLGDMGDLQKVKRHLSTKTKELKTLELEIQELKNLKKLAKPQRRN